MPAFSFLHAADLHLDSPFSGVGRVNDRLREKLVNASLSAYDRLIELAIERAVDFVVISGDIYDGAERGTRAQFRFLKGLRRLDQAGIPSAFIHGNHDPVEEGWSALRGEDFPSSTFVLDQSDSVRSFLVERKGELIAVVHGISFKKKLEERNLSRLFPSSRPNSAFQVGVLHTNVGEQAGHGNYAPCSLDDLMSRSIDYWALGHVHKRAVLRSEIPVVVYPGNIQGRGFDECGQRGATLVSVDEHRNVSLEAVSLDEVRFERLAISVAGCGSLQQVFHTVEKRIRKVLEESEVETVVARLELTGQCEAHGDLRRASAATELLETMRERAGTERIWLDSVLLSTSPVIDRTALRNGLGFPSAVVDLVDDLVTDTSLLIQFLDEVVAPLKDTGRLRDLCPQDDQEAQLQRLSRAESEILGILADEEASV